MSSITTSAIPASLQKLTTTFIAKHTMNNRNVNKRLTTFIPTKLADTITFLQIRLNCCMVYPSMIQYLDNILVSYLDLGFIGNELYHLIFSPSRFIDITIHQDMCLRCLHILLSPHLYLKLCKRYQYQHATLTFDTENVTQLLFRTSSSTYNTSNIINTYTQILLHHPEYLPFFKDIPLCLYSINIRCTLQDYDFRKPNRDIHYLYNYHNHPQKNTRCPTCRPIFRNFLSGIPPHLMYFTISETESDSSSDDAESISLLINTT